MSEAVSLPLTRAAALPGPPPAWDAGGSGQPLHFLHANGYPPSCYEPLFGELRRSYHLFGMLLRPLWPDAQPPDLRDWEPFTADLRRFLAGRDDAPVIGMGHSIGAVVTLRAALRQPELFRALVLIDPVLLPASRILALRVARALHLANRLNTRIEGALRRRRHFDSLDQLFAGYRRREIFQYFGDEELRALTRGITRPDPDGGYELVYSPEWEARIYETGIWNDWDIWRTLPSLRLPTLIVRGDRTDTFWANTGRLVQKRNPAVQVVTIPESTHLVPMERPREVATAAREFLMQHGLA